MTAAVAPAPVDLTAGPSAPARAAAYSRYAESAPPENAIAARGFSVKNACKSIKASEK